MKSINARCYWSILQIFIVLGLMGAGAIYFRHELNTFFQSTQVGLLGLVLNGLILALFLLGLLRMLMLFSEYSTQQGILSRFASRIMEQVADPIYNLPDSAIIVNRFRKIEMISRQNAAIDQAALAATLQASESTRFTLVRFIHNILILSGVFGTIISLSIALVGAAKLLDSPEEMQQMGVIIGGMSTALTTTVVAIVCYAVYAYFHLRLQDTRSQFLVNIEDVTMTVILPKYQVIQNEQQVMREVAKLTQELRQAAEMVTRVQDRFLHAGDRLQAAVDDFQGQVHHSTEQMDHIHDTLREGFRLPTQKQGEQP